MTKMITALEGVRILDMAGPEGQFCARLLADLGAEVIKVEPPGGDAARHTGPFKGDIRDPEQSILFLNLNTNKKSVVIDLTAREGRRAFKRLVRTADVVVETFPPGVLKGMGLDYADLRRENAGLVMASITGFGLSGPYAHFKAPSIVCSAMGGVANVSGSPDAPPLTEPENHPYYLASAVAAYGVAVALRHRDSAGVGQRVEVSCYEVQAAQQYNIVNYASTATILERKGSRSTIGGGMPYGIYPASDGHVHIVVISPAHWQNFVRWMGSPEALTDPMWENRHVRNANADLIEPLVMEWSRTLPRARLFAEGQAHHITVAPVNRPDEFVHDPHVVAREMFAELDHPVVGPYRLIRPPFRVNQSPAGFLRPAPTLGQHNQEVLANLTGVRTATGAAARGAAPARARRSPPLEGVRVLDFTMAVAGPLMTRVLGENGAEIIKVESSARQQRGRSRPDIDPRIVLQQIVTFADIERNRRSISVNMGTEEGRQVIRRLVPYCDVVVDNFSRTIMARWGLDYDSLRRLRRDIIMVRLPGLGLTGPYQDYVGLAAVAMGMTGKYHLWSYPDRGDPAGPPTWGPDYLNASLGSLAVVAALRHRARTGEGQFIELSQLDATATLLGTDYLDYFLNGRVQGPVGNGHRDVAPHCVYRCRGEDAWCAIAVRNDAEWQAFCDALGSPPWTREPAFATNQQRLAHRQELDRRIGEWTRDHTPHQVMHILQKAGVPAGAVQNGEDLFRDPHLRARGFLVTLDDPVTGPIDYPGTHLRLSETPGRVERCHGFAEDNEYVFGTLLGMSTQEVRRLTEAGVLV